MAEPLHERKDVSLKAVLLFGAGLIVAAILIHWVIERFYVRLERRYPPTIYGSRTSPPSLTPLPPQLQAAPAVDLAQMRARDQELLRSYGWVDRQAGIIRIPIERAMELTLQHGRDGVSPSAADRGTRSLPSAPARLRAIQSQEASR